MPRRRRCTARARTTASSRSSRSAATSGGRGSRCTSRVAQSELREQQPFNLYPFNENGLPTARFNYQDDIFHKAPATEQNLTVEGGNDQTRYYMSGNFSNEDGILRSTSSQRSSARVNLQQQLTSKLIGNVTANYITTSNQVQAFGEQNDYGIMGSLFFAPTNVDFRPVNGIYPLPPSLGTNPLLAIDRIRNPQTIDRFIGSTKLTYTPVTNLLLDYTIGVDNASFEQRQFVPRGAVLGHRAARDRPIAIGLPEHAASSTRTASARTPGSRWATFELRTTGGVNYTSQRVRTTQAVANGLAPVGDLVSAGSVFSATQLDIELRTLGFYAQQEVGWRDRLFLTGAVRYDASSTFAPSERWQAFPKFSASYVVDRQSGRECSTTSACEARSDGREASRAFSTRTRNSSRYAQLPFAGRPGFANDVTFGNPSLRNERAREWEVGTEVGFLGGRVGLEATYYNRLVSDLLFFRPLATSTGFSRQFYPIGSMSNKGVELMLNTTNVERSNFGWTSTVDVHAQQEPRREPGHSGFPIGGRISESHSCRASRPACSTARTRRATV